MLYVIAVSSVLPFPITIAALPCGMASLAHPTWAAPERKTTSMLLTVTSPGAPACGARACPTCRVVRTCTIAVAEPGRVTHVEQPDASTDGAAGPAGVPAGTCGRPEVAVFGPAWHPVTPATAIAAMMLATHLIRFLPPEPGVGPGGGLDTTPHAEAWPDCYQYDLSWPPAMEPWNDSDWAQVPAPNPGGSADHDYNALQACHALRPPTAGSVRGRDGHGRAGRLG